MKIEVDKLKFIANRVIDYISDFESTVEVETDYYLFISSDQWDDFDNKDIKPVIGSIDDDWTELYKLTNKNRIVTIVDLDRLASVLIAISEHYVRRE